MRERLVRAVPVLLLLAGLLPGTSPFLPPLLAQTEPKQKEEKKEPGTLYNLNVTVTLGDGREVEGILSLRMPEKLQLSHVRDGIKYEKSVSIKDIRSLEVTRWKGVPLKKNKLGEVYRFEPVTYTITHKDDSSLVREGEMLPFFKEIVLSNRNGSVKLFSYWIDLRRDDGTWYTGIQGSSEGFRNVPHKDVLKKIEFFADSSRAGVEP